MAYVDKIFTKPGAGLPNGNGILSLTWDTAGAIGSMIGDIVTQGLDISNSNCTDWTGVHLNACIGGVVAWLASIVLWVIMLVAILIALFRVWFELLKAYVMVLIYIILGPIWIVMGLFPGRPLGFGKWLRYLVIHLAVFPATACVFILARLFQELFKSNPQDRFIPPLIGNPSMHNFGTLGALGLILMAPTLLAQLKDSAKVESNKFAGAAIGQGIQQGMAAPGAVVNRQWANLNRRNSQTGAGEGMVSRATDNVRNKVYQTAAGVAGGSILSRGLRKWGENHQERVQNRAAGLGDNTHAHAERMYGRSTRPTRTPEEIAAEKAAAGAAKASANTQNAAQQQTTATPQGGQTQPQPSKNP
jgi:hypothetical protein